MKSLNTRYLCVASLHCRAHPLCVSCVPSLFFFVSPRWCHPSFLFSFHFPPSLPYSFSALCHHHTSHLMHMHVIIASGSASAQGSGWQLLVSCHAALPLRCQGSIHEAAIRCTGENATLRQQERLVLPRLCAVGVVKIGRQHVSWCSVLLQLDFAQCKI